MSAATVIVPTAKAARSPKIRKRMMVSPYLPPVVVVTARITFLVVSFHYQSVAIQRSLGSNKETSCLPI
jgi:hypothetical protein